MADPQLLSEDPKAGELLSTDPGAATVGADFKSSNETDAEGNPVVRAAKDFAGELHTLQPGTMLKSFNQMFWHPIDSGKQMISAHDQLRSEAMDAIHNKDYVSATRLLGEWALPIVTGVAAGAMAAPAAAGMGAVGAATTLAASLAGGTMFGMGSAQRSDDSAHFVGRGEYAKAAGAMVDAVAPLLVPMAVRRGMGMAREALTPSADTLDAAANRRVVDVITPKVGANKVRFANNAAEVAPAIARETTGITRAGLADSIATNLENASARLDAAHDARLVSRQVRTAPLTAALDAEIEKLTASPVDASKVTPKVSNLTAAGEETVRSQKTGEPVGSSVEPAPNSTQLGVLKQIRSEVAQLGEVAPYESIRRIRQAWDQVARVKYNPSMTQDFLAKQGEATAASKGTGVLRDALGTVDPETARANADYSLWRKANDVIQAAEETDRARPKVGRTIISRAVLATIGLREYGGVGAAAGAILGPSVEEGLSALQPSAKLVIARQLASLADSLRAGQVSQAQMGFLNLALRMRQVAKEAGASIRPAAGDERNPDASE